MIIRITIRSIALAALLCVAAGCGDSLSGSGTWDEHTQGLPFVIGYEQGMKQAEAEKKPAMMFVTADWCGFCTRHAEENFNDPEIKELLSNFVCVIVDGDKEKIARLKLNATNGYPHFVFLSHDGTKLAESFGYTPVEAFKPIVEEALSKANSG